MDPLETFVPPLVAAKDQLLLSKALSEELGTVEAARELLRKGDAMHHRSV